MGSQKAIYQKAGYAPLSVRMFGEFEVWLEGARLPSAAFGRPKTLALMKLLLCDRGKIFTAEMLAHHLFPELEFKKAIKNIHARISELRFALEPELIRGIDSAYIERVGPGCYRFNPAASVWLDTEAFGHQLSLARTYKKNGIMEETVEAFQLAIDTYRGSFLAQDIYDEWTIPSRDGWKLDYENALIDLAILYNKLERFQAALVCCNQGLLQNSFNEALYQEKMKALFGLGQREEAYRVFEQCSGRLQQMDASPATETIRLRGSLHEHFGGFESGNRKTSKIQKALLKGRYLLSKSTVSAAKQAYGYFQQAAMLDPESPDAHAGLADTHAYLVIYHQCSVDNHCDAAKAEALQAMSLDETSPAAQTALALVLMNFEWDGVQAEVHLKRAIELDPGYLPAYLRMAAYKAAWGEYQAALSFAYQAHELDPLSIETYMAIARIFYLIKDTDSMIDSARQALELDPHSYRAHQFMGQAYGLRSEQALELHHFQQSAQLSGGVTSDLVSLGHAYGSAGKRADAERILTKMQSVSTKQFVSPYHLGVVLAGMKEYQLAVDQLEQARQQRSWPLVLAYTEPRLSKLRSTSAYKAWANN